MSIETIRERLDAATPGPWTDDASDPTDVVVWGPTERGWVANVGNWSRQLPGPVPADTDRAHQTVEVVDAATAAFIAHARQDIPALLDIAESAAALLDCRDALANGEAAYERMLRAALDALEALP